MRFDASIVAQANYYKFTHLLLGVLIDPGKQFRLFLRRTVYRTG
jgi:hypothetical protein